MVGDFLNHLPLIYLCSLFDIENSYKYENLMIICYGEFYNDKI